MRQVASPPHQPMFRLPPMTKALLAANLLVFAALALLPERGQERVIEALGFTPERYHLGAGLGWQALVDPVTYQFLHGSIAHVGINMLGLVAFGAGVEQRLGRWRFIFLYLVCGVAGAFLQYAVAPNSAEVLIGASAAVSGIFGAILRFQAFRRGFWTIVVLWLVVNAVAGIAGVGGGGEPVAWIAHVGGFVAGLLLFPLLVRHEAAE